MTGNGELAMASAFDLTGQSVLVTGAAGGIGASVAKVCAALGARLSLADLEPPEDLAQTIRSEGSPAHAYGCDVSQRDQVESLAEATGPVGVLVSNAAICPWDDWMEPDWDATFERVISVNLLGAIHLARAYLPAMIDQRHGRIVLVGSVAGRMGGLIASPHYVASKGGLHALVRWLAQQGAPHNVIVNGVAPANTDTEMIRGQRVDLARIPLGRQSRAEEVAWPIAFLCSAAASYVCGVVLDVNGGIYVS